MATTLAQKTIPDHVPEHLVIDLDIYDVPGGDVDPQGAWRIFQGKAPLVYSPYNGGCWIPTEGDDVFRFFRDAKRYSSSMVAIPDPAADIMLPIQADPPIHSKHRANIQAFFTPSAVAALDPKIRTLTIDLIEGFKGKGGCEFVSEFALQLPLTIFLEMVGLPLSDRLMLRGYIETFINSTDLQEMAAAHGAIHHYLDGWVDERIANPGDDAISKVTQAKIDGVPYTRVEIISTLTLLLHAGLDTVANMMSFMALHLARHPKDRAYIRDNPDKMHNIIQELVRRYSGPNLGRVVAEDHVYKDVFLKKGDRVFLIPSFFNQDANTIDNPDEVDFTRDSRHITFGSGPHTCAGALLARRELAVFLEELVTRLPDFEIDEARGFKLRALPQNTVAELWLKWS